jgi:hypothetical protein
VLLSDLGKVNSPMPPSANENRWTALGSLLALCISAAEVLPKLASLVAGALVPVDVIRAVAAPLIVGIVLLASAIRRLWNPFGRRAPRYAPGWSILTGGLALVCFASALGGIRAAARSRLADMLVYQTTATTTTQCTAGRSVRIAMSLPVKKTLGQMQMCPWRPQDSMLLLVSHTGYIEEFPSLDNSDCIAFDFDMSRAELQVTACIRTSPDVDAARLVRVALTAEKDRAYETVLKEELKWYELAAFWF